jgi:hypothetical protein
MRFFALLTALAALAAPARAQEIPPAERVLGAAQRFGERVMLFYAGYAAGALSTATVGLALDAAGAPDEVVYPVAIAAYPVGVAGGVYGAGRLLGVEGSFRNALGDAVTGTAVGVALGGSILLLYDASLDDEENDDLGDAFAFSFEALGYTFLAIGVAAVIPVVWTVSDFRAAPAVAWGPNGEAVPGVALALRF